MSTFLFRAADEIEDYNEEDAEGWKPYDPAALQY